MVKLIKTVGDDDVIAECVVGEKTTELTNPIKIVLTPQGAGMMPFSPFSKEKTISLKNEHILFVASPEDEILNAYNQQFGGLVIPNNSKLII